MNYIVYLKERRGAHLDKRILCPLKLCITWEIMSSWQNQQKTRPSCSVTADHYHSWGSLAFREIFLVTISRSCNLARNMLAMTRGIKSYPLSAFMIFMCLCFVCWYYFQLNICSPGFLGGLWQGGGEGGSSSQSLHSIFLLCRPCNCKIFKFESGKIFSQLTKMLLNRKSRPQ